MCKITDEENAVKEQESYRIYTFLKKSLNYWLVLAQL